MKISCREVAALAVLAVLFVAGDVTWNIARMHPAATLIAIALLALVCVEVCPSRTEQSSSQEEA